MVSTAAAGKGHQTMTKLNWIAVDWGTSNLRAWLMSASGQVLEHASSGDGMGTLDPSGFEPALLALVGTWLNSNPIAVVACGMVGARQGWAEAPYISVPSEPFGGTVTQPPVKDARLRVHILPGMRQDKPADVMRGEETIIAGYIASNPDFDGVLCLPGTHTKWVHISAKEVVSFQTCMTGELFALLANQSVLRHSVQSDDMHAEAFSTALDESISRPERLAARLFSLRAESLLHGLNATEARSRLSGLLLGAELAAARPYWLGQAVTIIGAPHLATLYSAALAAQGVTAKLADGDQTVLAGLSAAYARIQES